MTWMLILLVQDGLIERLGDEDPRVREEASAELSKNEALLERAIGHSDPEISDRGRRRLGAIRGEEFRPGTMIHRKRPKVLAPVMRVIDDPEEWAKIWPNEVVPTIDFERFSVAVGFGFRGEQVRDGAVHVDDADPSICMFLLICKSPTPMPVKLRNHDIGTIGIPQWRANPWAKQQQKE